MDRLIFWTDGFLNGRFQKSSLRIFNELSKKVLSGLFWALFWTIFGQNLAFLEIFWAIFGKFWGNLELFPELIA